MSQSGDKKNKASNSLSANSKKESKKKVPRGSKSKKIEVGSDSPGTSIESSDVMPKSDKSANRSVLDDINNIEENDDIGLSKAKIERMQQGGKYLDKAGSFKSGKEVDNADKSKDEIKKSSSTLVLPVLGLRDVVCFPNSIVPLFVGRPKSVDAVERAMEISGVIMLLTEKGSSADDVVVSNLFSFGVVAKILQKIKLPNGTLKILVDIEDRAKALHIEDKDSYIESAVQLQYAVLSITPNIRALMRSIISALKEYVILKKLGSNTVDHIDLIDDPNVLSDTVGSFLQISCIKKQSILEEMPLQSRLEKILVELLEENEILDAEKEIQGRVKSQVDKNQKEYYLNEQIKAIRKELGDGDGIGDLLMKYETLCKERSIPPPVDKRIKEELKRLQHTSSAASGETVRSYLEWMFSMPWGKTETENVSLQSAFGVICNSHYGLDKVKGSILEYIAAQINQKGTSKGAVLCLYGPPGVGKTTLVKSIAKAMGRKYAKISLGGVRDEAEIRGHRKTYIAAMPGKIIQTIRKTEVDNPVILLDEIDKLAHDYRGDPESAMLEVLDPEQNRSFQDHYLEVEYDLSKVVFIATANNLNIRRALLDRLEVVSVPSYLHSEKFEICKHYTIPRCLDENGISSKGLQITDEAISEIITYYTKESGVRELSRLIAKIARKSLVRLIMEKERESKNKDIKGSSSSEKIVIQDDVNENNGNVSKEELLTNEAMDGISIMKDVISYPVKDGLIIVDKKDVKTMLGHRKYENDIVEKKDLVGIANGLAYTDFGGEILLIEALKISGGKGDIKVTGKLGEVMKESTQAAISYVKSRCMEWDVQASDLKDFDVHVHVPSGAVSKDGPSAGVTFCAALVSLLSGVPVRKDIAMTGEISLRGRVLPVGGIREKLVAALCGGVKNVLIPAQNQKDLEDIPEYIRDQLNIQLCECLDDVLNNALAGALPNSSIVTKKDIKLQDRDLEIKLC